MPEVILSAENLVKYYPIKKGVLRRVVGQVKAVDGIDLAVPAETLQAAGVILGSDTVAGARYAPATLTEIDTESYPEAG